MISNFGLRTLRDALKTAFLVDTFKIQAFALASDGSGGQTETWTDKTTNIAGFAEASTFRSVEVMSGGHQQEQRRWTLKLEYGITVDGSNRIVQTHSNGTALPTPRTFKIVSVIAGHTSAMTVDIEAVETPNV